MDDFLAMHEEHSRYHLPEQGTRLGLCKPLLLPETLQQLTTLHQLHHNIHMKLVEVSAIDHSILYTGKPQLLHSVSTNLITVDLMESNDVGVTLTEL